MKWVAFEYFSSSGNPKTNARINIEVKEILNPPKAVYLCLLCRHNIRASINE